jgi:hypothetical protein
MRNHQKKHSFAESSSLPNLSFGDAIITYTDLENIARKVGLIRRKPRNANPILLLFELIDQCSHGSPSYNDLACGIDNSQGLEPTKQAVALRLNKAFESFLDHILGHVIFTKIQASEASHPLAITSLSDYGRVLVQDSTIIKLPASLFDLFSGVSNATSSVCNARIQAVYDLACTRLISFSIDPYSKNDLAAAPDLHIVKGDLVLRDRGYLRIDEMQRHIDIGAHFIYRHKTHFIYLDPTTHRPIDLPALLKHKGKLDIPVLLNNKTKTEVRLVAAPVHQETADLRRMRAKKETVGHNPSCAVLELMGWTIFLTNIPAKQASFQKILRIYGLRWRIEVIFKAWKSHLKFDKLHRVSPLQLQIILKTRLLVIATASLLYAPIERALWLKYRKRLSLLKFTKYLIRVMVTLRHVIDWADNVQSIVTASFIRKVARYCCYDKRKNRQNFTEVWESLA